MNCNQEILFLFSLVVINNFNVHLIVGEKVTISAASCTEFFERSVKDTTTPSKATVWSSNPASDNKYCGICNSADPIRSWLITKSSPVKGYNSVHIDIEMFRASCGTCKNQTIRVYISDQDLPKDITKENIKILENLTLIATLSNKKEDSMETHHFQFQSNRLKHFSILFLSEGSCTRIHNINISYFVCEKKITSGVNLPRTVAPASGVKRVNVSCPENTLNPGNKTPFGQCSSEGEWEIRSQCMCKQGYTLDATNEGCKECATNTYKDRIGNQECVKCPKNSKSSIGESRCLCNDNYYRFQGHNYTKPCYGIPSVVKDVKFIGKTENSITLLWNKPKTTGTTSQNVHYDIKCNKCPSRSTSAPCDEPCGRLVKFKPSQKNLTYTNVTIQGLEESTEYLFVIYSKNENSENINMTNWARFEKKIKTEGASDSEGLPFTVIVAVPVVVVILIIVILILAICLIKRRKTKRFRASQRVRGGGIPLIPGVKNYIDPTTYDNPERAVMEFAKELDRNVIKFDAIIGGGEFGDVYKGEMKLPGQPSTKVAIKTLKSGANHKNRTDFLIEASVMGQFKNLNVITLEGVVTRSQPLLIVTEFMENGSLDRYLKENDGVLKPLQLLEMARGVASGMEYLAGMHFVHRDLAARNVLVNANLACKVADFGLSRDIGKTEESEYETQGGKIPVRWTAPEAITYRKFSTASDIWSYGILLWETMSFAERPYWNWGNEEVMKRVDAGYRLPAPMNCPKAVHQLMQECWVSDRTKRPPFKEIVRIIDDWIKFPEKLNEDYIKVRRTEPLDYSTFSSVKDWLEAIKMGMYATNFSKAGYEELSDVAELTEDELLQKVGVRLVGHRHKIYMRIKEMSEDMMLKREQSVRI